MDLLSEVLSYVQIESTSFGCLQLSAPWGFAIPWNSTAHFLCVTHGHCRLQRDGHPALELRCGDFVMFTRGGRSTFVSSEGVPTAALVDLIRTRYLSDYSIERRDVPPFCIHEGGGGEAAELVGGAIDLQPGMGDMLIGALPEFIHLSGTDEVTCRWLAPLMQMIVAEIGVASSSPQGRAAVSKRLAELLFVRIIQAHWLRHPQATSGWLRGLCDAKISKVLHAMHGSPSKLWTLELLAEHAGLSRSALAGRFLELIGEPPIQYLTRWRMHLAAMKLTAGERRTALLAEQLGYQSEIAFSRAFKRVRGVSPVVFRRSRAPRAQ
jgi:AraC-like DNA-binding protein